MRVLIVKTSALGDIVQAFPVAEYLKKVQGVTYIGWIAEDIACELVRSHPLVDEVIPIRSKAIKKIFPSPKAFSELLVQRRGIRNQTWDVVFDLQGNCKSACVTLMTRAKKKVGWGPKTAPESVASLVLDEKVDPPGFISMRQQYLYIVKSFFENKDDFESQSVTLHMDMKMQEQCAGEVRRWPIDRPCWVISLGSKWKNKLCVTEEIAQALAALQKELNIYYIFPAATTQELNEAAICLKKMPHALPGNVLYQMPLPVVQNLIARCDRFVGVDSLMLHLASTTSIPTCSFFGASSASLYAPQHCQDVFLQGPCPYGMSFLKRCCDLRTCKTGACMKQFRAKQIEGALRSWLKGTSV